jgi:DNA repair protein RadB
MERRLSTGCGSLDSIVGGGFGFGEISLIYGEASTGKTTLALSCVVNYLRGGPQRKAFYIDSDQRLSTDRLIQIVGQGEHGVLERLLIWSLNHFYEQTEIIEDLPTLLESRAAPVVIDSITGLYRLEVGDSRKTFAANKTLNRQLAFLSETAKTTGAAVLLIGQVRSVLGSDPPQIKPVAQRLLQYWSDLILKLEITPTTGMRQALLEKPGETPKACRYNISDKGLVEVE